MGTATATRTATGTATGTGTGTITATGLEHLSEAIGEVSLTSLCQLYEEGGRSSLLVHLKGAGVAKLTERQKLATAVGKAAKNAPPVPAEQ